ASIAATDNYDETEILAADQELAIVRKQASNFRGVRVTMAIRLRQKDNNSQKGDQTEEEKEEKVCPPIESLRDQAAQHRACGWGKRHCHGHIGKCLGRLAGTIDVTHHRPTEDRSSRGPQGLQEAPGDQPFDGGSGKARE